MNRVQVSPNGLERAFQALCPVNVVYSGDGSYWVRVKGEVKARNPDFVVLSADQLEAYFRGANLNGLRTGAVIECFGDYWHGPKFTGEDRDKHEARVVDYYARAGIKCLVLWESDIVRLPRRVAGELIRFLLQVKGDDGWT